MKAPVYRITCRINAEAILMAEQLEERGFSWDVRESNKVFLSKEWFDKEGMDQEDLTHAVEDICAVYEFDYTPEIEVIEDYEFEPEG